MATSLKNIEGGTKHGLFNFVWAGPRLLKLIRAGHCLNNIFRARFHLLNFACTSWRSYHWRSCLLSSFPLRWSWPWPWPLQTWLSWQPFPAVTVVLARNDPSPPTTGLIATLCPAKLQCLRIRHIFLRLDQPKKGSPWLHGEQWRAMAPGHIAAEKVGGSPFISEAPDTYFCPAFLRISVP